MNDSGVPVIRPAARIILLDSADRVFLMFFAPGQDGRGVWITPGGGLEPGETFEEAALRELYEELGLRDVELGPCVWLRSHRAMFGETLVEQQERFFVVHVDSYNPGAHVNHDEWERERIRMQRWWALDEIAASPDLFGPRDLALLLAPILRGELPDDPPTIGL